MKYTISLQYNGHKAHSKLIKKGEPTNMIEEKKDCSNCYYGKSSSLSEPCIECFARNKRKRYTLWQPKPKKIKLDNRCSTCKHEVTSLYKYPCMRCNFIPHWESKSKENTVMKTITINGVKTELTEDQAKEIIKTLQEPEKDWRHAIVEHCDYFKIKDNGVRHYASYISVDEEREVYIAAFKLCLIFDWDEKKLYTDAKISYETMKAELNSSY